MTVPTQAPAATTASGATPPVRERLRRLRFPLAIALVVLLATAALATLGGRPGGDLDPDSASPGGSRAVARILERQGVTVTRVSDPRDAVFGGATVLVVRPELLSPSQLRTLLGDGSGRLVVVGPDATALDVLAPSVRPDGAVPPGVRDPACTLPEARTGPARAGGPVYTLSDDSPGVVCFPAEPGRSAGSLVRVPARGAGEVIVLGQADVLTNAHIDEDANAALALRLLGASENLTWVVPDPLRAAPDGDASLFSLLPSWVPWVVAQVGLALLLALLWRGRRLGPVVPEPLPVAVRSAETLLGRARLYRRARATDRAAATLRTATLRRLAARLAVPPAAGPDAVAVRVAEATGQDHDRVRAVLTGPPPADERALVRLADDLDTLERRLAAGDDRRGGDRQHEHRASDQQQREDQG